MFCATFLAYKERRQWVWFAGLSVLAGVLVIERNAARSSLQGAHKRKPRPRETGLSDGTSV
jgi:hypothetical protein